MGGKGSMRDSITFVLNNRVETVSGLRGDTTLLNWLRQTKRLTGSKEGCAEGDCGACTVVVARPATGSEMCWQPVNACILFLGMLEGASVTTIEGIAMPDGGLHPCQQAMVAHHGSQCGFCTPGFVMSLFAAWCNGDGLSASQIDTTLAGNLCRCTGYRPIADAAAALRQGSMLPAFETRRRTEEARLMKAIAHKDTVTLSDGNCQFVAPATAQEFTALYAATPDATIVSGATDVGLWVTKAQAKMPVMLWTGRVDGFARMKKAGAHWLIGPAVTHGSAMDNLAKGRPDLAEVMRRFGSVQVRASGTVCGNIANGSPIGDLPPMLIALAAEIELTALDSNRLLPLEDADSMVDEARDHVSRISKMDASSSRENVDDVDGAADRLSSQAALLRASWQDDHPLASLKKVLIRSKDNAQWFSLMQEEHKELLKDIAAMRTVLSVQPGQYAHLLEGAEPQSA